MATTGTVETQTSIQMTLEILWEICQPQGKISFPELERYTRSDGWETVDNGGDAILSEEEAIALIRELQSDPEMDGWYATRPVDERYVTTIVEPAGDVNAGDADARI